MSDHLRERIAELEGTMRVLSVTNASLQAAYDDARAEMAKLGGHKAALIAALADAVAELEYAEGVGTWSKIGAVVDNLTDTLGRYGS